MGKWGTEAVTSPQVLPTSKQTLHPGELWHSVAEDTGKRVQTAPTPLCHRLQARPSHVAGMFGYCDVEQPPMHLFALQRNQSVSRKAAYSDEHLLVITIFPNCS